MNLPWEFLHDGEDFLVTHTQTPISRLPLGMLRHEKPPLQRILRMLVVISNPLDLPEYMVLNTEKEQEVILAALFLFDDQLFLVNVFLLGFLFVGSCLVFRKRRIIVAFKRRIFD